MTCDKPRSTDSPEEADWVLVFLRSSPMRVTTVSLLAVFVGSCTYSVVETALFHPELLLDSPLGGVLVMAYGIRYLPITVVINGILWWAAGKFRKTFYNQVVLTVSCVVLGSALMYVLSTDVTFRPARIACVSAGGSAGLVSAISMARSRMRLRSKDRHP